jgi:hypothetical protein
MSVYGIVPADLNPWLSSRRRIQLTDDELAPTGVENTAVTQATIDNAERKLHLAGGVYYQTPITPRSGATAAEIAELPLIVKDLVGRIASYDLMARKPEFLEQSERGLYWSQLNKANMSFLDGLQSPNRSRKIPAAAERAEPTTTTGGASVVALSSMFDDGSMRSY